MAEVQAAIAGPGRGVGQPARRPAPYATIELLPLSRRGWDAAGRWEVVYRETSGILVAVVVLDPPGDGGVVQIETTDSIGDSPLLLREIQVKGKDGAAAWIDSFGRHVRATYKHARGGREGEIQVVALLRKVSTEGEPR